MASQQPLRGVLIRAVAAGLSFAALSETRAAKAIVTITASEVGTDVVFSFSGSVNTAGLTSSFGLPLSGSHVNVTNLIFGPGTVQAFGSISGPTTIMTTGSQQANATSSTGDIFAIATGGGGGGLLGLPVGYVSGSALSGSATYAGSLTSLGITSGTFTWTWGTGANADSAVLTIGSAPSPAAAPGPLPLFGAGAAFAWSRRLRRRCAQG